jgi:hypothetical protein
VKARIENALAQYASRGPSASKRPASVSRPPDEGEVLLDLHRSKSETLRLSWVQWGDSRFLSIRLWSRHPDGTLLPSKRGVSVRRHELVQVRDALDAAIRLAGEAA